MVKWYVDCVFTTLRAHTQFHFGFGGKRTKQKNLANEKKKHKLQHTTIMYAYSFYDKNVHCGKLDRVKWKEKEREKKWGRE